MQGRPSISRSPNYSCEPGEAQASAGEGVALSEDHLALKCGWARSLVDLSASIFVTQITPLSPDRMGRQDTSVLIKIVPTR